MASKAGAHGAGWANGAAGAAGRANPWTVGLIAGGTVLLTVLVLALSGAIAPGADGGGGTDEDWTPALVLHLVTAIPAIPLGAWLLLRRRKGDRAHRLLGRLWAVMMLVTSASSFCLTGLTGGLNPIHIFSVVTPLAIARAVWTARRGNMRAHRYAMLGAYVGLLSAGAFAMAPARLLGSLVFG